MKDLQTQNIKNMPSAHFGCNCVVEKFEDLCTTERNLVRYFNKNGGKSTLPLSGFSEMFFDRSIDFTHLLTHLPFVTLEINSSEDEDKLVVNIGDDACLGAPVFLVVECNALKDFQQSDAVIKRLQSLGSALKLTSSLISSEKVSIRFMAELNSEALATEHSLVSDLQLAKLADNFTTRLEQSMSVDAPEFTPVAPFPINTKPAATNESSGSAFDQKKQIANMYQYYNQLIF